ncbi:MAG: DUF1080 domain-containing protein [Gemmataceae bacterium]|nr:DUF1080 domain-containing protein [Gemmataceae bacterium]
MHRFLCAALLLTPLAARAQDNKANTLTPQEVRDGWLLLFDGKTPFGWDSEGELTADKGTLIVGGQKTSVARLTTRFSSFELRLECRCEGDEGGKLVVKRGPAVRSHNLDRSGNNPGWDVLTLKVEFDPALGSESETLDYVTVGGNKVNGQGSTQGASGPAALRFEAPAGTKVILRNVKLKPLATKSLFNGKDLTGWKVFPGRKSKFTVTPQGELNVKDGSGDLQTEGKWTDFVVQLECRSNGKHLNSGIFFRCRAGEYQNGYEAQVRNQFTAEPTQVYTIEEYDPRTHQLTGKKKVKSTAVDYGTGAIYRRVPARMEMAKDGEWFTLTVVADGNRLATWVNGVQLVDWTDNRPRSDNARTGCCLNPGHISIQGHDPTTDLSFRNLRIAELPPEQK